MTTGKTSKNELRNRNPYQVPDGYFSDLRNNIMARVAETQQGAESGVNTTKGVWGQVRGLIGFAGAFGFLVLVAVVGFYFTGYQAQQKEQAEWAANTAGGESLDILLGYYSLTSVDVEELVYDLEGRDAADAEKEREIFTEAVTEYLEMFRSVTLADSDLFQ